MDPLTLQASNLGVVRPAIALQSDLSAVLREGRVLAGEVLQSFGGGALLIGVGRHRVPAQGPVGLEQGRRFLFVVEGEGEELALRLLGSGTSDEPALLRALRAVLGQDQPLGRLLEQLLRSLDSLQGEDSAARLARDLTSHAARPETGAARLAALLRGGGGLAFEARLAEAAALRLPAAEATRLAAELEAWLAGRLAPREGVGSGSPAELLESLRAQVVELLAADGTQASREAAFRAWLSPAAGAEPPPDLARLLEAAVQRILEGAERETVLARLRAGPLSTLGRGLETLLVRRLLGLGAPPPELVAEQVRSALGATEGDLKAQLLRALESAGDGPQREAVARALAGLEAEQLLNVARGRAGEPLHYSLPLLDGGRWTTAHLFVDARRGEDGPGGEPGAAPARLTLAVDLSCTGPLRADLLARPGSLLVRVRAAAPEVVAALSNGLDELETRLGQGGRSVRVVLGIAPEHELRVPEATADVRFLREHHLMDLSA